MKELRFSTVMPSASISTMNAVIPPRSAPCGGTFAITTLSSAIGPFVDHRFSPSIR
jgi:hypothetical protein